MSNLQVDHWPTGWRALRQALLHPQVGTTQLVDALETARRRQPLPVVWLIGKTQSGKTSIIRALTGSDRAEIGNGFQPCTRTLHVYDFPPGAPVVRFLDTRGLGEVAYDPTEDLRCYESQAQLLLGVMKVGDVDQTAVFAVLRTLRRRHPDWPLIIAQTGLHEAYPVAAGHPRPYPFMQIPWPSSVPMDLARLLRLQHAAGGDLGGRWVPLDFTLPEDGYEPAEYGLEALWQAIEAVYSQHLWARLHGDDGVCDLYARAAHPQIVGYALAAAALGALPLVDVAGVPTLQAKLLHSLAVLYQQDWNRRVMTEFLGLLGIGIGLGYGARLAGRALLKLVPGVGQTLGALWGASASGATTYALGKAAGFYFNRRRLGLAVDAPVLRGVFSDQLSKGTAMFSDSLRSGTA